MMRVLILGAGGHAQVVADILLEMAAHTCDVEPVGFLDDDPGLFGRNFLGLPVLGAIDKVHEVHHDALVIGVGDNAKRKSIFDRMRDHGERFAIARHPDATIARDVRIGDGTVFCAGTVVNTQTVIGANVILNTGCTIDHHNMIGDHVHIAPGSHLGGQVDVAGGAFVGIGATVIPQCRIGAWAIVGAGAVVIKDVPETSTVVGVPAHILYRAEIERDGN
jgi:sugar O-acyltransferase (sialic acid O-acetyltransferase NeuD family)